MDPFIDFTDLTMFSTEELTEIRRRLQERIAAVAASAAKPH